MISAGKLFGNYFDTEEISTTRLSAFAADTLLAEDTTDQFKPLRLSLEGGSATLSKELSDVSGALGVQKGKTITVDTVMASFKDTISNLKGVIAHVVGGFSTPPMPKGFDEYCKVTKTTLPTLAQRVSDMADSHAAALGTILTAALKLFYQLEGCPRRPATAKGPGKRQPGRANSRPCRGGTGAALPDPYCGCGIPR